VRKVGFVLGCLLLGLVVAAPANAAHRRDTATRVNWAQHDTAVYVVSTLNLLRLQNGQPVTNLFKNQLHVKKYTVEVDTVVPDLYFIDLVNRSNANVGTFAYKMGWQKPEAITDFGVTTVPRATPEIVTAYRSDHRSKVATFNSTLPS
jgi:hypothetical protein